MKKVLIPVLLLLFVSILVQAQESNVKVYNPNADAKNDIAMAIRTADSLNKNVFIQIGGNWCPWCLKFNKFCKTDSIIDTLMANNYVIVHLNYSKENKNLDILKTFEYPQRFGFPVFVILNSKGKLIHIQDSALLESGDGYDRNKVITFFKYWTTRALNPKNFEK